MCTETIWVPCPTCQCASDDRVTAQTLRRQDILPTKRCQVREVGGKLLTYVLKNDCGEIPIYVSMINYGTMIMFFVVTYVFLGRFLKQQETKFDEDEQTAQDYSVQVENPRKYSVRFCEISLPRLLKPPCLIRQPTPPKTPTNGIASSRKTLVPV